LEEELAATIEKVGDSVLAVYWDGTSSSPSRFQSRQGKIAKALWIAFSSLCRLYNQPEHVVLEDIRRPSSSIVRMARARAAFNIGLRSGSSMCIEHNP
jgi:hypothetical protein